jgi:hypothetical protein
VAVEEFTLCAHAHGVEPQQNFLQQFLRVKLIFGFVIAPELILNERHKGRIGWDSLRLSRASEISAVADAEFFVQLAQHDFNGVDMAVGKILIAAEKILEKAEMC